MTKSPDAFRTISEVSELLDIPAHVLRFWESRFPQIRPVKRAGGRRYYRPADVALLTGIKRLLHDDGITIRGVQKILREQGVRYVSGVADDGEDDNLDAVGPPPETSPPRAAKTARIIPLQAPPRAEPVAGDDLADGTDDLQGAGINPVEEQADLAEDELPADLAATVVEPPPPVMAQSRPAPAEPLPPAKPPVPEAEDLFSRLPIAEPPSASPPPADPAAEAPMAVWADESDLTPDGAEDTATTARTTGAAVVTLRPAAEPQGPAAAAPPRAPIQTGPTLAQRLRAVSSDDLAPEDRQRLAQIRDQALALRSRLSGPVRAQG
ncbi:MerR family transcriptional regulator [Pseudotabrizicola formosa]|uniref:MerR family transcriptional regulator n=1 Tax=Pseudotabrizicola formosa TaxID=2030009 RepID=UPI001FEE0047|nr:MerR family transcriptional regulator [Pseudotabrizicola formosa]